MLTCRTTGYPTAPSTTGNRGKRAGEHRSAFDLDAVIHRRNAGHGQRKEAFQEERPLHIGIGTPVGVQQQVRLIIGALMVIIRAPGANSWAGQNPGTSESAVPSSWSSS